MLSDGHGTPLAARLTKANEDDRKQLIPLIEDVPPIRGKAGAPRRKPKYLLADRGYDSEQHRRRLLDKGIEPVIAKRNTDHGSGLGTFRWVIERTISWLHQFRRLRQRWERRSDIHEAFMKLACGIICFRKLQRALC